MKKKLAIVLRTTIATVVLATGVYAASDIKLFINGKQSETDVHHSLNTCGIVISFSVKLWNIL